MRWLLLLLLSAGCAQAAPPTEAERVRAIEQMYEGYKKDFALAPAVDVAGYKELAAQGGTLLVDVRTPEERAVSMIPGAISLDELEEQANTGQKVVAYCTIGYRSGQATEALRAEGWDAYNLEGSILAWTHSGGDLVGPEGPTRKVHVYGRKWNLVADGYEAVW